MKNVLFLVIAFLVAFSDLASAQSGTQPSIAPYGNVGTQANRPATCNPNGSNKRRLIWWQTDAAAPGAGLYLCTAVNTWTAAPAGGSPGGANTQIQFNSTGVFAGDADLTFNGTRLSATEIAFSGSSYIKTLNDGAERGFQFTYPAGGRFMPLEYSIIGTNDVFFQGIPATTAGWLILEGYSTAGVAVGSGGNTAPVSIRINRLEVAKFDASATAGDTRMLLYDVDNGTVERVTVGAADSGGVGFKLLRIPN